MGSTLLFTEKLPRRLYGQLSMQALYITRRRIKFLLFAIFTAASSLAVSSVDEETKRDAICYIKSNAPQFVYGELPFSCRGRPERFVASVASEITFLRTSTLIDNFEVCVSEIFKTEDLVQIARSVWDLQDSPILNSKAAIAFSIKNFCNNSFVEKKSKPPNSVDAVAEAIRPAYMVVGPLPPGDLLNERAAPDAKAPVLNRLAPGTLVAVGEQRINRGTKWRQRDGDGGGWLAEKYLRLAEFQLLGESSTPSFGSCGGFEPSWSLAWTLENIRVDLPDLQETRVITSIQQAEGFRHALIIYGEDPRDRITFQFEEEACPYLPVDALLWGRGILTVVRNGETKQCQWPPELTQ